jgi:uncharacterized protein YbjT (DUF2867 family)
MSRREGSGAEDAGIERVRADLETGEGLDDAVAGVELIVHAASSPRRKTREIDVDGTGRLIKAAEAAGTALLFYISIVGIDRIPLGYYKAKLAAEQLIEQSRVPWSILRATQFHSLIDGFLRTLVRFPVALLPGSVRFQSIDAGEVAERLVQHISRGPSGRLPDLGGPEVLTFGEMARAWLTARRQSAVFLPLPLMGKTASALRQGYNCCPDHAEGKMTWEHWLSRKYG